MPQRTLEVINEAAITPETDRALRLFLVDAFGTTPNSFFSTSRHWHNSAPAFSVVGRVDGLIGAHTGVVVRHIRCGSTRTLVAGIQNFCVSPRHRGTGLGPWLMQAAMDEARQRDIPFGLLFCVPALERYYGSMGWDTIHEPATMNLAGGPDERIPGKNIVMGLPLSEATFPRGPIHLQGPDW